MLLSRDVDPATQGPIWGAGLTSPAPVTLQGDLSAGVVVVGAGVAGLSTALHLAQAGIEVVVLEADTVGSGSTGVSAGIVAPQLVRTSPHAILEKLGADRGEALLRFVAESGTYLFDLVDRHRIDCDASRTGFIAPATGTGAAKRLRAAVEQWKPYRGDLSVCGAEETRQLSGCRGYSASLIDRSGGAIDPQCYAMGLAVAAQRAGARIYERSRVVAVDQSGDRFFVRTGSGCIQAPKVVLAANGGNGAICPELAGSVLPLPVCEVATAPLPESMRAVILPERHSLTDLEPDIFTIRYAAGGRLVTALPVPVGTSVEKITRAVNQRFARMLVTHEPLALQYVWHGVAWVNSNMLPRLVEVQPGLIAVQACNGRGLSINSLIGREVARTFGVTAGAPLLALEPPTRINGYRVAQHLPKIAMSLALSLKRFRQLANPA